MIRFRNVGPFESEDDEDESEDDDLALTMMIASASVEADRVEKMWMYQEERLERQNEDFDKMMDAGDGSLEYLMTCAKEKRKRRQAMRRSFNAKNRSRKARLLRQAKRLVAASLRDPSLSEPAAAAVIDYAGLIFYDHRPQALLGLIREAPPELFWRAFLPLWPSCGVSFHQDELLKLLRRNAPAHPFFNAGQAAFFEALPPTVTIFRGCSRDRRHGLSWSTSHKIADELGRYLHGYGITVPIEVVTSRVRREDIIAVFSDDGAQEILIDPTMLLHPPEVTCLGAVEIE
jgi:hypothetical protein